MRMCLAGRRLYVVTFAAWRQPRLWSNEAEKFLSVLQAHRGIRPRSCQKWPLLDAKWELFRAPPRLRRRVVRLAFSVPPFPGRSSPMPRPLLLASIGCLFVVAGVQFGSSQETRTRNGADAKPFAKPASGSRGFMVGTPVRYKNLTIFPVLSKSELNSDRFITLNEGLRAHTVEVLEMGAGQRRSRSAIRDRRIPAARTDTNQRAVPQSSRQTAAERPRSDRSVDSWCLLTRRTSRRVVGTRSIACWSSTARTSLFT